MNTTKDMFVLDANIFIDANNRYYARDLCAEFWSRLADFNRQEKIFSIDRIYEELKGRDDDLHEWAIGNRSMFVTTRNKRVEQTYSKMMEWVEEGRYSRAAKEEFGRAADGWLSSSKSGHVTRLLCTNNTAPRSSQIPTWIG